VDVSALGRPNDLRHFNRRPRIRNQLGLVPASELGAVGSDDRDNAASSGPGVRLALAEFHTRPRGSRDGQSSGFDHFVRDVSTILPAPAFPHVVSKGRDGILS
jgi:hypothetical protein